LIAKTGEEPRGGGSGTEGRLKGAFEVSFSGKIV
jgi:hypothetical protein